MTKKEEKKSEWLQLKIERIDVENPNLNRWDVVIFWDTKHWLQLWIIKSNYVDHNTDYSWNYVQTGSKEVWLNREKGKEILEDIYTPEIYCKITGEWADKLRKWIDYNLL